MILDSISDPQLARVVMWKRTISVCAMMLGAWAALIGTITLVMLVAISHAKGEIPATSANQDSAATPDSTNPTAPKLDTIHPARVPQVKASTRI